MTFRLFDGFQIFALHAEARKWPLASEWNNIVTMMFALASPNKGLEQSALIGAVHTEHLLEFRREIAKCNILLLE